MTLQKTLRREAFVSGIGLFTGERVSLKIGPGPANSGIVFQRIDLKGKPEIPARVQFVRQSPRCTRLATETASIHMVEHLLSAFHAMQIDNARIEVEGPEVVAGDGSANLFVDLIEQAGIEEQEVPYRVIQIKEPTYWSEGEISLIALPSPEFRLSYMMHYPHSALLRSQYYSCSLNPALFKSDIAPCRTFSLYEEIWPLVEKGMIKGGGLENALVIKGDSVMNPEGVRFSDEPARHKMLDLIGDLSLVGAHIQGYILAVRSGHASNVAFAKILSNLECC